MMRQTEQLSLVGSLCSIFAYRKARVSCQIHEGQRPGGHRNRNGLDVRDTFNMQSCCTSSNSLGLWRLILPPIVVSWIIVMKKKRASEINAVKRLARRRVASFSSFLATCCGARQSDIAMTTVWAIEILFDVRRRCGPRSLLLPILML